MKKPSICALFAIALTSTAAHATPEAIASVSKVFQLSESQLESMTSPMEGWSVVMPKEAPDQYLLASNDGRYVLFQNQILDVEARNSVQNQIDVKIGDRLKESRKEMMSALEGRGIVFAPKGDVKGRISVFTEPSCPYCRRLHENLDVLTDAGIEVTYYIFPRSGMNAPLTNTFISMWADAEQRKERFVFAYEEKNGWNAYEGLSVSDKDKQVAAKEIELMMNTAVNVGLKGTPYIISEDGRTLSGYRDPQAIIDWVMN